MAVRVQRRTLAWAIVLLSLIAGTVVPAAVPSSSAAAGLGAARRDPSSTYACHQNNSIDAIEGADATASAIGWAGNYQGVVTCLGGSFFIQDGLNKAVTFGIYQGGATHWSDADGYLPAQVTSFRHAGASVRITEFGDRIVLGGDAYVVVYCRVAVTNSTSQAVSAAPDPSPGLVTLAAGSDIVPSGATSVHDYAVAVDRFGNLYPWPSAGALNAAGGFAAHFADMRAFWNGQLAQIAQLQLPSSAQSLVDAYRNGFITTQIARSGTHLNTGVNGYDAEFSHDVVGILANLFTQGDFSDAHALLLEAGRVVGSQGQYDDGIWTYAWPWAIYLMKTGDLSFVKANFSTPGPAGSGQPSIEQTAHMIAAARTGPGGTMEMTDDIDSNGYWTIDDYEALMGLAAYAYLARQVGDMTEAQWAVVQYIELLSATNAQLTQTIRQHHLTYLPCSLVEPNSANRCANPKDANWAAPFQFGRWAWDAPLFGATVTGPGLDLIDATYDYGFGRLHGLLPANTFGGYPGDYYSTGYNAGYGEWGLASTAHRDQGILGYQFMIGHTQSGPLSWWESSSAPAKADPWVGSHPSSGQGASPHAWGMAEANMVLLDSVATQSSNGDLIVGRGVPAAWLTRGQSIGVTNFPSVGGGRLGLRISSTGRSVTLRLEGTPESRSVLFELPVFVHNVRSTTAGTVNQPTGTVRVPGSTHAVTVRLARPVG